jgi:hypothetical protein
MADDDVKVDQAAADAPAVDAEPTQSHLMRVAELRFAYSVEASEETKAAILAIVNEHSCVLGRDSSIIQHAPALALTAPSHH